MVKLNLKNGIITGLTLGSLLMNPISSSALQNEDYNHLYARENMRNVNVGRENNDQEEPVLTDYQKKVQKAKTLEDTFINTRTGEEIVIPHVKIGREGNYKDHLEDYLDSLDLEEGQKIKIGDQEFTKTKRGFVDIVSNELNLDGFPNNPNRTYDSDAETFKVTVYPVDFNNDGTYTKDEIEFENKNTRNTHIVEFAEYEKDRTTGNDYRNDLAKTILDNLPENIENVQLSYGSRNHLIDGFSPEGLSARLSIDGVRQNKRPDTYTVSFSQKRSRTKGIRFSSQEDNSSQEDKFTFYTDSNKEGANLEFSDLDENMINNYQSKYNVEVEVSGKKISSDEIKKAGGLYQFLENVNSDNITDEVKIHLSDSKKNSSPKSKFGGMEKILKDDLKDAPKREDCMELYLGGTKGLFDSDGVFYDAQNEKAYIYFDDNKEPVVLKGETGINEFEDMFFSGIANLIGEDSGLYGSTFSSIAGKKEEVYDTMAKLIAYNGNHSKKNINDYLAAMTTLSLGFQIKELQNSGGISQEDLGKIGYESSFLAKRGKIFGSWLDFADVAQNPGKIYSDPSKDLLVRTLRRIDTQCVGLWQTLGSDGIDVGDVKVIQKQIDNNISNYMTGQVWTDKNIDYIGGGN